MYRRPLCAAPPALSARRLCVWGLLLAGACHAAGLNVGGLRCEYQIDPLGIDTPQPRLSWVLESRERGQRQTAFQVLAATSQEKLAPGKADLWDSGKVAASKSINVGYAGKALISGQRVHWKTRVWDKNGKASGWSRTGYWEMALLKQQDWRAQWISRSTNRPPTGAEAFNDQPAPLFRKAFVLDKKVARARAYVSGLGYYEFRLNGQRVGDHVLDPGWTSYSKRVLYSTYDITGQLKRGENALGMMLGNGWFNPLPLPMWGRIKPGEALTTGQPRAIAQLQIEFVDGSTQTIATDETWLASDGPILRNSVYLGEVYDARREQPGWDTAGFDDSRWEPAVLARGPELGQLRAQDAPPIRVSRSIKPVRLTEPKPGVYIFDFGENFSGWARLKVRGDAGTRVRLRSGELLYPDGTLNGMTAVCGQIKGGGKDYRYDGVGMPKTAFQLDEYILKGTGSEVFTPRFTFHGFRYVEVTGFPGKPGLNTLEGLVLHSDVASAGSFSCSNELFNRIQQMTRRTLLANIFSVQSDCPHREKFAYGGDIAVSSEMAMFNFDMSRFYAKAAQDLVDAARPNGGITETAPYVGIADQGLGGAAPPVDLGDNSGPVDWGLAHPILCRQLYQHYGDRRVMEEQYGTSARWVALLRSRATDGILDNGISDHESLVPKPRALTGTAAYYHNVKLLAEMARILGKDKEASEAEGLASLIKQAFNRKFLQAGTGQYGQATQASQAIPLYLGLVPDAETGLALKVLIRDIEDRHKGHLSTGIFGTKYMLNVLTDLGRPDLAYSIVNQRDFPGWGHMVENGATTLWEHWKFSDSTYSHNHPMFGCVSEWFFKALAGLRAAPDAVGFDRIIIDPQPVGDLQWAQATHQSVHGPIKSAWKRSAGKFELRVRIPIGATAIVRFPAQDESRITESGQPIIDGNGLSFAGIANGKATVHVQSGEYVFVATTP